MLAIAAVFGPLLVIAFALFPGYTFFDFSISSLGSPEKNPDGWFYFSIAMWAQAVLIIPFFFKVARVFEKYTPRVSKSFVIAALVTSSGLVLLGFFPEAPPTAPVHYVAAMIAFGGFIVDGCISWLCMYRMARAGGTSPARKSVILGTIPAMLVAFWGVAIGAAIAAIVTKYFGVPASATLLANVFFWEWLYMGAIGLYMLLLEIVISREPEIK